jgi:hypothetical protein
VSFGDAQFGLMCRTFTVELLGSNGEDCKQLCYVTEMASYKLGHEQSSEQQLASCIYGTVLSHPLQH